MSLPIIHSTKQEGSISLHWPQLYLLIFFISVVLPDALAATLCIRGHSSREIIVIVFHAKLVEIVIIWHELFPLLLFLLLGGLFFRLRLLD